MRIAADTHVHVYPGHDLRRLVQSLHGGLQTVSPDVALAYLTESRDCHAFDAWVKDPVAHAPEGVTLEPLAGGEACRVESGSARVLFLPGRQVVAAERIEILALATSAAIPDGAPAEDIVRQVIDAGGVPVIAWAPGKWFFSRGTLVQTLLEMFTPQQLLLGDSRLRPTVWLEPLLMRRARRRGFRIVAGSDPLPFSGDEIVAGSYGSVFDADFDMQAPLSSARRLLLESAGRFCGGRGGPIQTGLRLFRHARG